MNTAEPAFSCCRCGHCCQGEGGVVLTSKDQERLARHLNQSLDDFLSAHTCAKDGKVHLACGQDGFCVFFQEGCGVHLARPDICRAWPFFRGNLLDANSWEMCMEYCPGINHRVNHEEFVRQGLAYLRGNDLAKDDSPEAPQALCLKNIV
jgi:hypothetical protein